jgi:steroid delta-isomerase-like uncharacterized protein
VSADENKALIQRYFEAWNDPDIESAAARLDDILHPEVIDHGAYEGQQAGIDGFKAFFTLWRTAFPDFTSRIHDQIAEGDRIATRWSFEGTHLGVYHDLPPTGRYVRFTGISINRIEDGLVVDEWIELDQYSLRRQLAGEAEPPGNGG